MPVATSRFARAVHNEPRFRVPRGEREEGRARETRANSLSLLRPTGGGQMSEPVLKISKGDRFRGPSRGSLRRNKKGFNGTHLVRPLYYLSRCYPMNAQCIWIADKGLDFSRAPENFCIFASYRYYPDKEISYQFFPFTHTSETVSLLTSI